MQLEQIAVLFVFIGNAASIVLLAFMLHRIMKQTEATHVLLSGGTHDLLDAGKRLREAMKSTDRLMERLSDINAGTDRVSPGASSDAEEKLKKIESMLQDLSGRKLQDQGTFLEDIKNVLDSLTGLNTDTFAQWRDANQNKLETAQAQRNRMATEMEALKVRLDEANKIIQELRRSVRLAEAASQSAEALRANLDQQQQLLARAKERAQVAESRAATLSREIELMQAEASRAEPNRDGASTQALKRQLDEVTRERDTLQSQMDRLKEMMQRTLIEKDFIEEKLLDLDAEAASRAASSPSTPSA
ncbi:MAG: hypothetical protein ACM3VZ_01835 [Acidobacteriota bacterium]